MGKGKDNKIKTNELFNKIHPIICQIIRGENVLGKVASVDGITFRICRIAKEILGRKETGKGKTVRVKGWAIVNGTKPVLEECDCHKQGEPLYFIFVHEEDARGNKGHLSEVTPCIITYTVQGRGK